MKLNWREVCKFLSGAAFMGMIANIYMYLQNVSLTLFGLHMDPWIQGIRAVFLFFLFLTLFTFGYAKKK